jgi:hypothetical protein
MVKRYHMKNIFTFGVVLMKKILSSMILGATLFMGASSMVTASSRVIDGVEIIKEQDSASRAVRVKVIITDSQDLAEIRYGLQRKDLMSELKPHLEAGDVTYQDLGNAIHMTILRSVFDLHLPELSDLFEDNLAKYLPQFDRAPARSVLFETPPAFNPYIYGLYNPDVKAAYNPTRDGAYENFMKAHFFNHRLRENRSYKLPDDFSSANYLKLNPDLASAAYAQPDPNFFAISHYIQNGRDEKRAYVPTLPTDFDANEYFALNPDVAKAAPQFSWEQEKFAKEHYLKHGFAEGRAYKADVPADFDPFTYRYKNPDVQNYLEKNNVPIAAWNAHARVHYMKNGHRETRIYK